ncbi:MAG: SLATT domain-containing protein [Ignavibacteriales bacterium]|nr:SLATT domain-containing protein [Melioribacteraceae bacterium]MCF8316617.1 SLATT domain-containing protein [Ignavibacteriales bacterium]MCF8438263.1 SLATT domain-containing protein [Ignavibacteriales bacterium]
MNNTIDKLKRIKVDALYGKKKHFNAAVRIEKTHLRIGVPLIIINVVTGSLLFSVLTDNTTNWVKYIPLVLAFIAALLSGFQTYFNLPKKVEGHRRVGNKHLSVMKKCDRLQGYIADNLITNNDLVLRIEELATEIEEINKEAESYPTSKKDYELAKKGIETGEETYTSTELEI